MTHACTVQLHAMLKCLDPCSPIMLRLPFCVQNRKVTYRNNENSEGQLLWLSLDHDHPGLQSVAAGLVTQGTACRCSQCFNRANALAGVSASLVASPLT